ncbi:polysaccharide export protein [candidate division KSB1 bacterium]|nr:polysaccharide export protein [candidate division KSB1 bacterium]
MLRTEREFSHGPNARNYERSLRRRLEKSSAIFHKPVLMLLLLLALFGCAGNKATQRGLAENAASPAVNANASPAAVMLPEYRVGVLDELEIRVQFHERLNELAKVRPDGRITLQEIGELYVLDLTAAEIDRIITEAYSKNLHTPEVTVFVRNFAGRSVYVLGEVDKPGRIDLMPNMTVLQALAAAGGTIRGAKMNSVVVLRPGSDGKLQAMRLDLNRGAIQNGLAQDQILLPQDLVFVPKTFIANVNEFLTQIYDGLFPPFDIYLRAVREYNRR